MKRPKVILPSDDNMICLAALPGGLGKAAASLLSPPPVQTALAIGHYRKFMSGVDWDEVMAWKTAARRLFQECQRVIGEIGKEHERVMAKVFFECVRDQAYPGSGTWSGHSDAVDGLYRESERIGKETRAKWGSLAVSPTASLGGFDASGWKYEGMVEKWVSSDPDGMRRYRDLVSWPLKFRIDLGGNGSYFTPGEGSPPNPEIVLSTGAGWDFGGGSARPTDGEHVIRHEMVHYAQACMGYLLTGEFNSQGVFGGSGRGLSPDNLYDRDRERGDVFEDGAAHTNTSVEFWANVASAIGRLTDDLDRMKDYGKGSAIPGYVDRVTGEMGSMTGEISSYLKLKELKSPKARAKVVNAVLRAIREWRAENGL